MGKTIPKEFSMSAILSLAYLQQEIFKGMKDYFPITLTCDLIAHEILEADALLISLVILLYLSSRLKLWYASPTK